MSEIKPLYDGKPATHGQILNAFDPVVPTLQEWEATPEAAAEYERFKNLSPESAANLVIDKYLNAVLWPELQRIAREKGVEWDFEIDGSVDYRRIA